MHTFVAKTLRYIYTSFWAIWIIFHGLDTISVEKKIAQILLSQRKNGILFAKNRPKISKIFKILEINDNHLNTLPVQILGHLGHFWPKNENFCQFLGHILP